MNKQLLEILRCPNCFCTDLIFSSINNMSCKSCLHNYPVVHGIPIMITDKQVRIQSVGRGKKLDTSRMSSNRYDELFMIPDSPREFIERFQSLSAFKPNSNGSCLDLGSGTLRMAIALGKQFKRVVAIDLSIENLLWGQLKARKRGLNIDAIVADVTCLPIVSTSFDAAIGVELFEHLTWKDRRLLIKEISRVCKKGSPVLFNTWNYLWNAFVPSKRRKEYFLRGNYYRYDLFSEVKIFFKNQGINICIHPQFATSRFNKIFNFLNLSKMTRYKIDSSLASIPVLGYFLGQFFSIGYIT